MFSIFSHFFFLSQVVEAYKNLQKENEKLQVGTCTYVTWNCITKLFVLIENILFLCTLFILVQCTVYLSICANTIV